MLRKSRAIVALLSVMLVPAACNAIVGLGDDLTFSDAVDAPTDTAVADGDGGTSDVTTVDACGYEAGKIESYQVTLAEPGGLFADETGVYISDLADGGPTAGRIIKCPTATCDTGWTSSNEEAPGTLVGAGTKIFVAHTLGNKGITSCLAASGGCTDTVVTTPADRGLAISELSATTLIAFSSKNNAGEVRCCTNSCATQHSIALNQGNIVAIRIHEGRIYWSSRVTSSIRSVPTSDCVTNTSSPPTSVTPTSNAVVDLALRENTLYWTETNGRVMACQLDANGTCQSATKIATANGGGNGITLDDKALYYTDSTDGGAVWRCDLPSCACGPQAVALDQAGARAIVTNAKNVFFTVAGGVRAAPK